MASSDLRRFGMVFPDSSMEVSDSDTSTSFVNSFNPFKELNSNTQKKTYGKSNKSKAAWARQTAEINLWNQLASSPAVSNDKENNPLISASPLRQDHSSIVDQSMNSPGGLSQISVTSESPIRSRKPFNAVSVNSDSFESFSPQQTNQKSPSHNASNAQEPRTDSQAYSRPTSSVSSLRRSSLVTSNLADIISSKPENPVKPQGMESTPDRKTSKSYIASSVLRVPTHLLSTSTPERSDIAIHRSRSTSVSHTGTPLGISASSPLVQRDERSKSRYQVSEPVQLTRRGSSASNSTQTTHKTVKKSFSDLRKTLLSFSTRSASSSSIASHLNPSGQAQISPQKQTVPAAPPSKKSGMRHSSSASSFSLFTTPSLHRSSSKPKISLPVPLPDTQEKLNRKLANSTSVMSLSSVTTINEDDSEEIDLVMTPGEVSHASAGGLPACPLDTLVAHTEEKRVISFDELFAARHPLAQWRKLGEATYSEVYTEEFTDDVSGPTSLVLKVLPFGGAEETEQPAVEEITREVVITKTLMQLPGFVRLHSVHVVRGKYSERLLKLWDDFNEQELDDEGNGVYSENDRPDYYLEDQLFCVLVLDNVGIDLENFALQSWREASLVFWKCACFLAHAEEVFQFEHRDLHWGNVVIQRKKAETDTGMLSFHDSDEEYSEENLSRMMADLDMHKDDNGSSDVLKVTIIDYTLSRASVEGEIYYYAMENPDFFAGKGDYQFDIYRFMRNFLQQKKQKQQLERQQSIALSRGRMNKSSSKSSIASFLSLASRKQNSRHRNQPAKQQNTAAGSDWEMYLPQTNIMWLHYLADKLLNCKGLPRMPSPESLRSSDGGRRRRTRRSSVISNEIKKRYSRGSSFIADHSDSGIGEEMDWSDSDEGDKLVYDEAVFYHNLNIIHRSIDPRKKMLDAGGLENVHCYEDGSGIDGASKPISDIQLISGSILQAKQISIESFTCTGDFLFWGWKNNLIKPVEREVL